MPTKPSVRSRSASFSPSTISKPALLEFPQWHRLDELEGLIGETPARTLAGVVAQLRVASHWLGGSAYAGEAVDAGLENALATLERLAGEARS